MREQHEPGDGDELERDAVREDHVEGDDGQRRDDHVEAVERQPAVPVHGPAGQLEVREQVIAQVRRRPHVGTHVATGRRRVVEHEVAARRERVQVDDHHHDDRRGHQDRRGDEQADDPLVRPRPTPPGDRPTHDPPAGARVPRSVRRRRSPTASACDSSIGEPSSTHAPSIASPYSRSNHSIASSARRCSGSSRSSVIDHRRPRSPSLIMARRAVDHHRHVTAAIPAHITRRESDRSG